MIPLFVEEISCWKQLKGFFELEQLRIWCQTMDSTLWQNQLFSIGPFQTAYFCRKISPCNYMSSVQIFVQPVSCEKCNESLIFLIKTILEQVEARGYIATLLLKFVGLLLAYQKFLPHTIDWVMVMYLSHQSELAVVPSKSMA